MRLNISSTTAPSNNWVDDTSVSIRKNDYYYDSANVLPRSVYFSINNEQDTRLDKLKDKTYSVSPLTKDQAHSIESNKKYTISHFDSGVLAFAFNCGDSVLKNKSIRRALASSLDVSLLTEELGEISAKGIVPDSLALGGKRYRDMASAVSLYKNSDPAGLFEKGLSSLKLSSCNISIICSEEYENTVRRLMQSWQASLGIKLGIYVEVLTEDELASRVQSKNYQIALLPVTFSDNTAFHALELFTSNSSGNFLSFSDKNFDSLISAVKYESGIDASVEKTRQAEKYLIDSAAIIPLYEDYLHNGLAKGVSGTYFNLTGDITYFKYTLSE